MKPALLILTLLAAVPLTGCMHEWLAGPAPVVVEGAGRVVYVDLEGGFYGIEAAAGEKYLPLNLPAAFHDDGLAVRFRARLAEDVVTIQQWGTPVELLHIERAP